MSLPALATRGLAKSFGSLVVASNIEIELPQGVRYALIGPNGAGKTTLINLMTGMLRPDAGQILLDDADITALAPDQRVRRGLVRTYQINSLFPHLSALESVTLAVCERSRAARTWWRQLPAYGHEIDEAYGILSALNLDAVCNRATRELAYGQQRLLEIALALATRPKVLLLDEPAAGVPREESKELFAAIAGLSREVTVLFIEHDMELVFRFASRIIVMVGGRVLVEGSPQEIASDPRVRAVYLGKALDKTPARADHDRAAALARQCARRLWTCRGARRRIAVASRTRAASRCSAGTVSASRRCCSPSWATRKSSRGRVVWHGEDITRRPPHRRALAGIGWVAQEREIFVSLSVEENLTVAARPGRWDLPAVYDLFPRLAERRSNFGNQLSGGEQQMLAIARALMTNPDLLLLDEPLEGLAPIVVEELATAIRRMTSEGANAFILVEQHADIALSLTQAAIVIERGRIVHSGPSAQLLADHAALDRLIGLRLAEA